MPKKYTPEQREASDRYTRLKSRLKAKKKKLKEKDPSLRCPSLQWDKQDFISWYTNKKPKKCHYCGCTKAYIEKFWKITDSKRYGTRGKSLEIDRLKDENYSENNCVLACYWCNNAKSDVFTPEEFKPIGCAIGKVIQSKIKKKKSSGSK